LRCLGQQARRGSLQFTFLYYDIPYHNNHAEQQICPHVLLRKITFGNRSSKGILNHSVLTSIIQTAKLNKICSLNILREILLAGNTEKNPTFTNPLSIKIANRFSYLKSTLNKTINSLE